jgi:hypothetical protein
MQGGRMFVRTPPALYMRSLCMGAKSPAALCASALHELISSRGPGNGPGPLTRSLSSGAGWLQHNEVFLK